MADLVKMLDSKTGNQLQNGVNDGLHLFEVPRTSDAACGANEGIDECG